MNRIGIVLLASVLASQWAAGQLTFTVSTDKPSYASGETIELLGTVSNQTDTATTITGLWSGLVLPLFFDDVGLYTHLLPTNIPYVFPPGVSQAWLYQLEPDRLGLPNKDGIHMLRCSMVGYIDTTYVQFFDSVSFTAPAFHGGQLMVHFSAAIPPAEMQSLRDSAHAATLSSDTSMGFVTERWQIIGIIADSVFAKYEADSRIDWMELDRFILVDTVVITQVSCAPGPVSGYVLAQNYPNPFNPTCTIRYDVPKSQWVRLSVYDVFGRLISVLIDSDVAAGTHKPIFDGSNLASGVYIYRLQTDAFTQTRRMVLVR